MTITRENAPKYQMEKKRVTIELEQGDLYEGTNTVKNLFLFDIPETLDKNDFRAVVTMEGLPVKESEQWDTASFVLYKDDDNYLTVGKKSHKKGIAFVKEVSAHATEEEEDAEDNNQVTKAVFGFHKQNNSISVDYKIDGSDEWHQLKNVTDMDFGQNFKIGFAGWVSKPAWFPGARARPLRPTRDCV